MIEEYRLYFEELCEEHTVLAHQDVDGQRVFDFVNMRSAFGAVREDIRPQHFIFRLIIPRFGFVREGERTFEREQCGFMIAKFADIREGGDDALTTALDESAEIVKQFAYRMVADSRNGHPLFNYSADKADQMDFNAQVVEGVADGSYFGYMVTFALKTPALENLDCNNDNWNDDGLTAY